MTYTKHYDAEGGPTTEVLSLTGESEILRQGNVTHERLSEHVPALE